MKKHTKILAVVVLLLVAVTGVLSGMLYGMQPAEETDGMPLVDVAGGAAAVSTEEDLSGAVTQGTQIMLEGDRIVVTGTGAQVSGTTVKITQAGTYSVSGTLENGQINVDAGGKDTVILSLNGIDISNSSDAAIHVENAGQTLLVLENGTDNRVQSGTQAEFGAVEDDTDKNGSGAAIYARDDLAVTGGGTLQVFGYINNGIHSTNNLTAYSGNIEVIARNNGLKGKDSVSITGGSFTIHSGGDGIKSDDTTGIGYGVISISGGTFFIETDSDGVQAETVMEITGGEFNVISGGGSETVSYSSNRWGEWNRNWDMEDESSVSTKGFKSGVEMRISGGSFSVNSRDDGFHSNGSLFIAGGTFVIASGDDGIHADTELEIEDGEIQITASYEGIEANQLWFSGGDISITALDDGINAYGGQNNWGWGGSAKTTEETPNLYIMGANIVIDADGDGLDSNGNIYVESGFVVVNGPSGFGNGAIDYGSENGGVCLINGGTVFAIGSSSMAETFDEKSGQCTFRHYFSSSLAAGSEILITDKQGNVLFEHSVIKPADSVVFSCPELKLGGTYLLSVDGQTVEIEQNAVSTTSGQPPRWGW